MNFKKAEDVCITLSLLCLLLTLRCSVHLYKCGVERKIFLQAVVDIKGHTQHTNLKDESCTPNEEPKKHETKMMFSFEVRDSQAP